MAKIEAMGRKLIVRNNLTYQPKTVVNRFSEFVEKQEAYNVSMRQDYSKNKIELQLLGRNYTPGTSEYPALQTRYIPVTSALKTYKKTAKEMMKAEREIATTLEVRKSPLTRVMEFLGL